VRGVVVCLLAACSFEHGQSVRSDGGADTPDTGDAAVTLRTRKLVLDNSASAQDFGPHPVLVALDPSKIDYSLISDPTTDLRFEYAKQGVTASIGDNVPFEIEKWDPSGESIVWIRVPEILKGTADTAVLMHYGPAAAGAASAQATWSSWELVNHMTSGLAGSMGAYDGNGVNVTFGAGQIGDAALLAGGTNQGINFANSGSLFNGWTSWTLSFWIYANYNSAADLGTSEPAVMDKGTSLTLGRLYAVGADIRFQVDLHFESNVIYAQVLSVPPKTWTMVTITSDGNTLSVGKNGNMFGSADLTGTNQSLLTSTMPFFFGSMNTVFAGGIDELRIEKRSRSNDYARAQYLNMTRQFVTFVDP
jgi:hypothetical protein